MRAFSLLFIVCLALNAQAVAPRLTNIVPAGGQLGTELEVRFTGQRLEDTKEVVFYNPGISIVSMDVGTNRVKATVRIAPDCRIGEHRMRLRTATGVSEVRTFWISAFTNLAEVEPNSDIAKAQRVALNSTINGTVPNDDSDYFLVTLVKGQRLTAEIEGLRLGRSTFDPFIAIQDRKGRPLAASEDSSLGFQDGIVSIIAPENGEYLVQVRESAFGGNDSYQYRLHIGTFPRPTAVYPVAARAGETTKVRFIGDVKGDFEQEIKMPAMPEEKFGVIATGVPSPNWMRVTPFPTALEAEPNDSLEQAGAARDLPVVFNGILSKPGDQDWFRFHAKKGQNLRVNVFARHLRSPLDSYIQVVNAKGSAVADNDDASGPDSSLNFKPDEDGEYAVLVRDHLKRGGSDFVYCLEVAAVEPAITVKIPDVARNDTQTRQYIAVPRGNRFATLLSVRRSNLGGDLVFAADKLPAGVKLQAETLPDKVDQFPVVFEATADAPVDGRLVEFSAAATNGISGQFFNDIELVQGPNNTSYYGTRVNKLLVAVTEAAPYKVGIEEPKVPLVQGGTMDLKIVAEREPGFDEPINVKMVWNPPGVTSQPDITIPKGATSASYPLSAKPDAQLSEWKIAVSASAKVNDGDLFVSSQLAKITLGEPFVTATMEKSTCEPGGSTNIVVKLEQKIPFEGKATIRIVGLSDKFILSERHITKDDKEVVFPVKVDASCSPGSQRNLFCTVAVMKDGQVIPHNVAQGGSFRVVPAKKQVASK